MKLLVLFSMVFTPALFAADKKADGTKNTELKSIVLAGGCFWCMEPPFEKLDGIKEVISGYGGVVIKNPPYKKVASGQTKHREVVKVVYNPEKIKIEKILDVFWRNVNPTDKGGQFVDRGFQYSTAIFYADDQQKKAAEKSKANLSKNGPFKDKIVTPIIKFTTFYPAEDYHQDYYKKNPIRYKFYRYNSGRDTFINKTWKSKS